MTEAEQAAEREILTRERATRPIAVRPDFVRVTGSFDGAVFLSQLLYWFGDDAKGNQRARVQRDGYAWVAKSAEEWAVEVGCVTLEGKSRPHTIRRVVKELCKDGLIVTKVWKFAGVPTVHYKPNWTELKARLTLVWSNPFDSGSQIPELTQAVKSILPAAVKSITEITSETTTENTQNPPGANGAPPANTTRRETLPTSDQPQAKPKAARKPRAPKPADPLNIVAENIMLDLTGRMALPDRRHSSLVWPLVNDIRGHAGDNPDIACRLWLAFVDGRQEKGDWKYVKAHNARDEWGRWAMNGGAPTIAEIVQGGDA